MRRGALAVLLLLPLVSCRGDSDDESTPVLHLQGAAEIVSASGSTTVHDGEHRLEAGDTVRLREGTGRVDMPGDGAFELREGRGGSDDSVLRLSVTPEVLDGDALVLAGEDRLRVRAGRASISLRDGAAKVRRSTSVLLGVYEGAAEVDALGRELPGGVRAYRQVSVTDAGGLPRRPVPLVYDGDSPDAWDRRFLGDAIVLAAELERRSRELDALAPPGQGASFFTGVLPPLRTQPAFGDALVDVTRSVGETLVGASIALGGPGDFVGRWRSAFGFRGEGADWGLVALDQRARRDALFDILLEVVPLRFGGSLSRVAPRRIAPPTTTTTTTPSGGGSPPTTQPPGGGGEPPPPTVPPTTVPGPIDDLIGDLLGNPDGRGTPTLGGLDEAFEPLAIQPSATAPP